MRKYIKIHPADKVAVALCPLDKGTEIIIGEERIILSENIPQGHKFALQNMDTREEVIKYGHPIGVTILPVKAGEWVHVHNMKTALGEAGFYVYDRKEEAYPLSERRYFQGYRRVDGKVGVRNDIWIIPTVGCVNGVASVIECRASVLARGSVDAIAAFLHPYGCSQMGGDQENTRQILADLINHPNAGGVLVLGLGCENSNIGELKKYIGYYDKNRVKFLNVQDVENEIEEALTLLEGLIDYASGMKRELIPLRELIVGLKCGGSDGLSGITANPAVGICSDLLIAQGGTSILTEIPEMFGAETILMNRCRSRKLFQKTVTMVNDFKEYFMKHDQVIYENPSPGNKAGGISTLEDKSLGCVQKSGSAPVCGVLSYGEVVKEKGLNLLSAPGNDLVASTALAASGAHVVLFTTGRGTPFASPVPTVKISSNSKLARKKNHWIDFDCGAVIDGADPGTVGSQLFDYVIAVASGEKVKSERMGVRDMAIFKQGVTL
ncbi:hypothetical protein C818_00928 [Lachnospiraceae bacterium MD308]|nr:hypothetical protein C818_00928 [Lachnospiraceae bacterium MD308]MCI8502341.1 altronate dehydratase [Dorea sp.]